MISRRLLAIFALIACLGLSMVHADDETYGAEPAPGDSPIGGGEGYQQRPGVPTTRVDTVDGLLAALKAATEGDIIYIDDQARLDLTGHRDIVIPAGVTLASGRGLDGSPGALLYTKEDKATHGKPERFCLLRTGGPNVRLSGLRLRGPDGVVRQRYDYITSDGIQGDHDGLEVDNCEIWAWSHGGVYAANGRDIHVHHNYIHHCQRAGLGYCVVVSTAEVLIEANIFDYYRHAIAGSGRSPSGYEARYNIVGENATMHAFDMHGGADRGDGTHIAGDWIKIHHNTFQARSKPIVIRGRPKDSCEIYQNWFVQAPFPSRAIHQTNASGNMAVGKNAYTADKNIR